MRLSRNCENHTTDSPIFCEDSGWGDEEANVVCKSKIDNTTYGLGGNFHSYSPYNKPVILLHIISHQIIMGLLKLITRLATLMCTGREMRRGWKTVKWGTLHHTIAHILALLAALMVNNTPIRYFYLLI